MNQFKKIFLAVSLISFVNLPIFAMEQDNRPDESGWAPLHHAAYYGELDEIARLIGECTDIDIQVNNPGGRFNSFTPLHFATKQKKTKAVILLLRAGANPNAKTDCPNFYPHSYTPLHIALHEGDIDTITALLDGGADPEARVNDPNSSYHGYSPLHVATYIHYIAAVKVLLEKHANPNSIIERPIDGFGKQYCGCTPLHVAANEAFIYTEKGAEELIQMLIDSGADKNVSVNIPGAYYFGLTPIRLAMLGADQTPWGHQIRSMAVATATLIKNGTIVPASLLQKWSNLSRYIPAEQIEIPEEQIDKTK